MHINACILTSIPRMDDNPSTPHEATSRTHWYKWFATKTAAAAHIQNAHMKLPTRLRLYQLSTTFPSLDRIQIEPFSQGQNVNKIYSPDSQQFSFWFLVVIQPFDSAKLGAAMVPFILAFAGTAVVTAIPSVKLNNGVEMPVMAFAAEVPLMARQLVGCEAVGVAVCLCHCTAMGQY